jgi:hypothetical protein
MTIGHCEVPVPAVPDRILLLIAAAARDGRHSLRAVDGVQRAMTRVDDAVWRAVVALAAELGALTVLRAGLEIAPGGEDFAKGLRLPASSLQWRVAASSSGNPAVQLARLVESTWRERLFLLGRELLPSPAFMRIEWPQARRGATGLLIAYLLRLIRLARRLPRDVRIVRTARREE